MYWNSRPIVSVFLIAGVGVFWVSGTSVSTPGASAVPNAVSFPPETAVPIRENPLPNAGSGVDYSEDHRYHRSSDLDSPEVRDSGSRLGPLPDSPADTVLTAEEIASRHVAHIEARFESTLRDSEGVARNYELVGTHISKSLARSGAETELSCSSVLCILDVSGGIQESRKFMSAFNVGWPVEGFEANYIAFRPDENDVVRHVIFRDGEYIDRRGKIGNLPND